MDNRNAFWAHLGGRSPGETKKRVSLSLYISDTPSLGVPVPKGGKQATGECCIKKNVLALLLLLQW